VIITFAFALVAGYAVLQQRQSVRDTALIRTGYVPLTLALRDAVALQNSYNSQLNHITEARNPGDKRVWFETSMRLGRPRAFMEIRSAMRRVFTSHNPLLGEALGAESQRIERFLEGDRDVLAQLFSALDRGEPLKAEQLRDQLVTRGNDALTLLRTLEDRVNVQLDTLTEDASRRELLTLRFLLGWAVFSILVGIGVGLYARRLLQPLERVTQRAKAVASGDLTPHEVVASHDEIGELAHTFESMVAAIARASHELRESERLATIGKMAAHVTHEVRNPLSSIALNLELLDEELSKLGAGANRSEAQLLHQAIKHEVERLTELTEQYLSLARRNEPTLEFEDFAEVVLEALMFVEPDLTRHGVEVERDIAEALPPVRLDEAQIRQVLHNLLRNARQAMPKGGRVTVRVRESGDGVELEVADTGEGIDPLVSGQLFEPFVTTKSHGTGLGLSISRHIIETHGGSIRCEANAPRGTRFVVHLPAPSAPVQA
jgi:signal transduction histidine kinase